MPLGLIPDTRTSPSRIAGASETIGAHPYARFADLGHEIMRVRDEVTARMPTPDEVIGLTIPDGVPVLDVLHTGIDAEGQPFEVTNFIMRADLNGLDYRMPVED